MSVPCDRRGCHQPATHLITARGTGGYYQAGACTRHQSDVTATARRHTAAQPAVTPLDQPGNQFGRQDDLFGDTT